jgi:predicted  nucleic acid-binding Zn-ribbon protein
MGGCDALNTRSKVMDYEYYYNAAKRRYCNACSEIGSCENRITSLRSQRQQKINQINQLEADIKSNQEAFDGMSLIIKSEEGLNSKIADVDNKTGQASVGFAGMVDSSGVSNKSLTDVYGDEMAATRRTLSNVLTSIGTKRSALGAKTASLQGQLRQAKSDLQDIDSGIRSAESNLGDWRTAKTNASYDMEYYRRKMNEAA